MAGTKVSERLGGGTYGGVGVEEAAAAVVSCVRKGWEGEGESGRWFSGKSEGVCRWAGDLVACEELCAVMDSYDRV